MFINLLFNNHYCSLQGKAVLIMMSVPQMVAKGHVARFVKTQLDHITVNVSRDFYWVQISNLAIPVIVDLFCSTIVQRILIQIVSWPFVRKPQVFANLGQCLTNSVRSNALQIIVWQKSCLILASPLRKITLKWTSVLCKLVSLVLFLVRACSGIMLLR